MSETLFAMDRWTLEGFVGASGLLCTTSFATGLAVMAERVRRSAGVMDKISAVIFGGLAARTALN